MPPVPDETRSVYTFICRYIREHGYAPSLREIAQGCFVGRSSLYRHLDWLEAHNWIVRDAGRSRGLRLGPRGPNGRGC